MKKVEPFLKPDNVLDYETRSSSIFSGLPQWLQNILLEIDDIGWIMLLAIVLLLGAAFGAFMFAGRVFGTIFGVKLIEMSFLLFLSLYNRCFRQGRW